MIESEDILCAFILIVVFPVIMVFVVTWIKVLFMIRTLLCHECFVIETREALQELRELNKKPLRILKVRSYEKIEKTI